MSYSQGPRNDRFSAEPEDSAVSDDGMSYADSPADGYFTQRNHPRDVFVPNPSTGEDTKEHANSSTMGHFSQLSSPAASLRSRFSVESLAILDAGPAPPDYAAATANNTSEPRSSPRRDDDRHHEEFRSGNRINYGSIPRNPDPFGQQWPFGDVGNPFRPGFPFVNQQNTPLDHSNERGPSNLEQQNMSDAVHLPEDSPEDVGLLHWDRKSSSRRKSWLKQNLCKPLSCFNVCIAVAIVIIIILITRSTRSGQSDGGIGDGNNKKPSTVPDGSDLYKPPVSPNRPSPPHAPLSACPVYQYTDTMAYQFHDPDSFTFVEAMERTEMYTGSIGGQVHVRPAQGNQESDIVLYLSIATSEPWKVSSLDFVQTESAFILYTPNLQNDESNNFDNQCMEIYAWVDIRKGVSLDTLNIDATHLNITVDEGLFKKGSENSQDPWLDVKSLANLSSVSGNIHSTYLASRETIVRTVSGDITGEFSLRDVLGIFSTSGIVTVDVDPQEAAEDGPAEAQFMAETVSGDVSVTFPTSGKIPVRLYDNRVVTISADISGSYILGHETTFRSTSGNMEVSLLPYHPEGVDSTLKTSTNAAQTDITILSPFEAAGTAWRQLSHTGSSTSGQISVVYPPEWEGTIDASTISGDVNVSGNNVRIITDDNEFWRHRVVAQKGSGSARSKLENASGGIKVKVGV